MHFSILDFEYLTYYLDVKLIIIFGSCLVTTKSSSDIDVLIVSDDFAKMIRIKRKFLVRRLVPNLPIDAICVAQKEYNLMRFAGTTFAREILATGEIIYER
jgi:hypothetical protein